MGEWGRGVGGWGCSIKIWRPRSRGWKNFGRRWTREVGCLENWTILMDVICVSSLNRNNHGVYWQGWHKKILWSSISIVVSYCPLDKCPGYFYERNLVLRSYENTWWQWIFFKVRLRIACLLVWSCDYWKLQQLGCTGSASGSMRIFC